MGNRLFLLAVAALAPLAGAGELGFKAAGEGAFAFDTGALKGTLRADGKSQGILPLVDVKTGANLAHSVGILSYYRLFSAGKRYGDAARNWPTTASLLPDGALGVHWPAHDTHPLEVDATFRWASPTTLDLETVVKPSVDMPKFEVFLSSYFGAAFRSRVYVRPARYGSGKPGFLAADANPLVVGTYLAFPRDLAAAQIVLDGRWELGSNPVQWSITRYLAAPLAMRRDEKADLTCLMMSRPEDCFAVLTPYNQTPPDGVAGHYSLYFSLFGGDVKAGQSARALVRMVVDRSLTDERAVELYQQFIAEKK